MAVSVDAGSVTFGEFAAVWLSGREELVELGVASPNTLTADRSALAAHVLPFFAAVPLDEVDRRRCEVFRGLLSQGGLKPSTVNSVFSVLRRVLRAAIADGEMHRADPTGSMRPLLVAPRRFDCYSAGEARRLVEATPDRYRAIVALAVWAGLRQGEIHALTVRHVDLDAGLVSVRQSYRRPFRDHSPARRVGPPKTPAAVRDVPIRQILRPVLEAHLSRYLHPSDAGYLFAGRTGTPLEPVNFRPRVYVPTINRAGLRWMRFHDLRHTFVTQCAEAGVPIPVIARWVGHTSTYTTEIYLQSTRRVEDHSIELLAAFDEQAAGDA